MTETSTRLGYYRHFKGGIYKATGHGVLEATQQLCVIYEDAKTGAVFIRPLSEWCQQVQPLDAAEQRVLVPRFSYLGQEPPATLPGLATPAAAES